MSKLPRISPHMVRLLPAALLAAGISFAGCATSYPDVPRHYILQYDGKGLPVSPAKEPKRAAKSREDVEMVPRNRGWTPTLTKREEGDYIDAVLAGMDRYARRYCENGEPCKLLFFIHGGLSNNRGAIRRVMEMVCGNEYGTERCDEMGPVFQDDPQYPLFVIWNSSLLSSYRDHLVRVHKGRDVGPVGVLGAPAKIVADTGKTVSRMPIVWYEMLSHDLLTVGSLRTRRTVEKDAENYYESLEEAYDERPGENARVARCVSSTSLGQRTHAFVKYVFGLPFKLLSTPFIDGLGTVSWDVMLRRTELLFEREQFCGKQDADCDYELVADPPESRIRRGGLARFLDHLIAKIESDEARGREWTVTLIGHSAGSIIANKMLDRFPDLPVKNVVYMASAGTIGDYERSAFSLLQRDDDAEVFHLVLDPVAELRERYKNTDFFFADLAPRGSLLVWIDNFLSKPNAIQDRAAGRFANIARSVASTPPELKSRVSLTVFGVGKKISDRQPQKHGEFSEASREFWMRDFWEPDFSTDEGCE